MRWEIDGIYVFQLNPSRADLERDLVTYSRSLGTLGRDSERDRVHGSEVAKLPLVSKIMLFWFL